MSKMRGLLKVAETIGMDRSEIDKLLERLVQFLILDYAVNSTRVKLQVRPSQSPPTSQQVLDHFKVSEVPRDLQPSVSGLSVFLTAYHRYGWQRPRRLNRLVEKGCQFPVGCPYSDLDIAKRMAVPIEQDHLVPHSRGGGSQTWDFQPLCKPHNILKGNALFWTESRLLPLEGWI